MDGKMCGRQGGRQRKVKQVLGGAVARRDARNADGKRVEFAAKRDVSPERGSDRSPARLKLNPTAPSEDRRTDTLRLSIPPSKAPITASLRILQQRRFADQEFKEPSTSA